eukprot:c12196_g3_i2.p1 GENE.c12196_g3_i2~~c12196_g3_i2.p1  ORF type:complete len:204 (-),score=51.82 c12196_g3_i2:94-705(-)
MEYLVKKITFQGKTVPIVLQNKNGPCPLIAICNVLLLRGKVTLSRDIGSVNLRTLYSLLTDVIFAPNSNNLPCANTLRNLDDAMELLPLLSRGLDVNIRFNSVGGFEYSKEMVVFDVCDVRLVHGWLVDPQQRTLHALIGNKTYNQVIEFAISLQDELKTLRDKLEASSQPPQQTMQYPYPYPYLPLPKHIIFSVQRCFFCLF